MEQWQVVVVGGGAAGLLAAARAAERGRQTLLLEKNRRPGVKILMSGGTRCNITHATDERGIVEAFGRQGRFLHSALARLGPQQLVELIEAEGVATKVEATGKIFPVSNKATDVLQALLDRFEASGARLALEEPLLDLKRAIEGFELGTSRRTIQAEAVIITSGGRSYPGSGTTGDAYGWLERLGHTIVAPRPALVPITTTASWVHALRGVTIPDVAVRVVEPASEASGENAPGDSRSTKPRILDERRGSFLFTHFGLSGPSVLDVSRAVSGHPNPQSLSLECDVVPGLSESQVDEMLRLGASSAGKKQVLSLLPEEVPHRLGETLLELSGIASGQRAAETSKAQRARLVAAIKRLRIPITGTRGFQQAEVTAGGVDLSEVDSRTMQSKLVPGLFIAGEVLDLDGPIGGYNFQAAFSTGWLAGENA